MGIVQSKRRYKESKHASYHPTLSETSSVTNLQKANKSPRPSPSPHRASSHEQLANQRNRPTNNANNNNNNGTVDTPPDIPHITGMTTRSSDYAGVQSNSQFLPYNWEDEDRFYTLHFALRDLFSSNVMPAVLPRLIKGACVVDIGCGNGPWITDMATQYSECEYVGVEPSVDMLPEAMPLPNVRFEVADIMDKLPFESNSVDVVHIRAQGLQFKKEEWVKALREVYRVLKPGGMVQLLELHNALTGTALIESFIETVRNIMKNHEKDYDIATKLGPILEESGFQLAQLKKKKVHFASDGRLGETFVAVTLRTFQAAQDFLAPLMGLDIDDYRHRVEMVCAQCVKHNAHLTWYAYVGKKP